MRPFRALGSLLRTGATATVVCSGLLLTAVPLAARGAVGERPMPRSAAHVTTGGAGAVARSLPNDSAEVAATVARFHRALAEGDSATALRLLTEDAIILESGGVETKEEYRGHHLPSDIAFARAVRSERSPTRVVVRGDVAWATSTSTARGEFRGRQINSQGAELMVLTRTAEGWRISAIHWSSRALRQ